ncbi:Cytochrome P450 3A16 [Diaporthe amygdali]|uniref:Cytochrome P450 3A16 n=1 Tax=Phomopsis amygdali TaxID=1214568 RepID=UPI0022FF1792|nr:Cytochrome P450 3A16 [Diaporthe amygdali]KAJ0123408.1 Cytochrome P450 3A16 [Diaporthe amygdali]
MENILAQDNTHAVAVALPILTLLAFPYHRATHRRPYNGIPYNPHSTRRLFGDMRELTAKAQRHRDPAGMTLAQFGRLESPVIQLFFMLFWRPTAAPIVHRAAAELVELWRKVLLGSDVNRVNSEREAVLEWEHAIEQPASRDEPAEMAVAPLREEFKAGTRHWATKRRLMNELLVLSKARFAGLGDAKDVEGVAKTPAVEAILAANIPYLDASIEELVRKSNAIPEVVREAACDAQLLGHRVPKDTTLVCCTYVAHKPFDVPDGAWSATSTEKRAYGALWQQDMDDFHSERWLRDDGTFDAKALPRLGLKIESLRSKIVFATQHFRIVLVVILLDFELLLLPENLNSPDAFSKITRSPCQCFVRLRPI